MSKRTKILIAAVGTAALILTILLLTGCADFQRMAEIQERTQEQFELAAQELREAWDVAEEARADYTAALEDGDDDKIVAALAALQKAEQNAREREVDFEETQRAFELAKRELEDAESGSDYLWGILGLLGGAVGGGVPGFAVGKRRAGKQ